MKLNPNSDFRPSLCPQHHPLTWRFFFVSTWIDEPNIPSRVCPWIQKWYGSGTAYHNIKRWETLGSSLAPEPPRGATAHGETWHVALEQKKAGSMSPKYVCWFITPLAIVVSRYINTHYIYIYTIYICMYVLIYIYIYIYIYTSYFMEICIYIYIYAHYLQKLCAST